MVNRKKKIKTCDKGSQEEDMISKLPVDLISNKILTHLSTKDVVRTSVLSSKWRNVWKSVPGLDLDSRQFSKHLYSTNLDAFVNFVDRCLDSQGDSWIRKLKLYIQVSKDTKPYLSSWIDVVTKRKIQQLDVRFEWWVLLNEIPLNIYTCETLVQLRLCETGLVNAEFVSLPCLKIMCLEYVRYDNKATIDQMISASPVLEDLTIIELIGKEKSHKENIIQVCSQTLKRIRIGRYPKVEIDAPLLQFLKTKISSEGKNFKISSSGFLDKVDIDVIGHHDPSDISDRVEIRDILTDISKAKELVISGNMWKGIFLYSKLESLLQFHNLSRLTTRFFKLDLEMLPTLLENCPNLESLILVLSRKPFSSHRKEKEPNVIFSTVPCCLVSSLKFVKLKRLDWSSKYEGELEHVRYLLKNSTVLEKLRLDKYHRKGAKCDILKDLLAMPRCSSTCEVLIL